jgi:hypothetical protein
MANNLIQCTNFNQIEALIPGRNALSQAASPNALDAILIVSIESQVDLTFDLCWLLSLLHFNIRFHIATPRLQCEQLSLSTAEPWFSYLSYGRFVSVLGSGDQFSNKSLYNRHHHRSDSYVGQPERQEPRDEHDPKQQPKEPQSIKTTFR